MKNREKNKIIYVQNFQTLTMVFLFFFSGIVSAESIPRITTDVPTEFGTYQPVIVNVTPSVTPYEISEDLSLSICVHLWLISLSFLNFNLKH